MRTNNKVLRILYMVIVVIVSVVGLMAQNSGTITVSGGAGGSGGLGGIAIIQNVQPNDSSHNDISKIGWNTITLNTERYDDIGVTLTGDSIFTLPPGRYVITTAYATIWYKFRIYNVTNDVEYASTNFGILGSSSALFTPVTAAVNLSSNTDFKYQIISNSGGSRIITADSYPGDEIFAQITIIRI